MILRARDDAISCRNVPILLLPELVYIYIYAFGSPRWCWLSVAVTQIQFLLLEMINFTIKCICYTMHNTRVPYAISKLRACLLETFYSSDRWCEMGGLRHFQWIEFVLTHATLRREISKTIYISKNIKKKYIYKEESAHSFCC